MSTNLPPTYNGWEPPIKLSKAEVIQMSEAALSMPSIEVTSQEEIIRIEAAGMEWDIGFKVYQPKNQDQIVHGADGKKAGFFILHGGDSDYRSLEPLASILTGRMGYKTIFMAYPGRLYLHSEDRNWPGDTINSDGTARTPLWTREAEITADQYDLISDKSDIVKRRKWGTLFFLKAKEGSEFYYRMAAWPLAFEEGMKEICRCHYPVGKYSVYTHGHSTGGPFAHILLQRVENVAGLAGFEGSPFGYISAAHFAKAGNPWTYPFNYLVMRTWRHLAKYLGPESGLDGVKRLPMLMEEVFEAWEELKKAPQFKAEYMIQYGATEQLEAAARVTAKRLGLNQKGAEELVERYVGYVHELSGSEVKPVPPLLLGIAKGSILHTMERYQSIDLPMYSAMKPVPKVRLVYFDAGVHNKLKPEEGLPMGIAPAVAILWHQAIKGGFYMVG